MTPALTPFTLKRAYSMGYFPMDEEGTVSWRRPRWRGLMPMGDMEVSRSLRRTLRKGTFQVTFDQAFREVMEGCRDREDTWISEDFVEAYTLCHEEGWGHSCEVWKDGRLVGGVYGLAVGGVFCGESMFSRERDASKVALKNLMDRCLFLGFGLFDCQVLNSHTLSLGGFNVHNDEYLWLLDRLGSAVTPWSWNPPPGAARSRRTG